MQPSLTELMTPAICLVGAHTEIRMKLHVFSLPCHVKICGSRTLFSEIHMLLRVHVYRKDTFLTTRLPETFSQNYTTNLKFLIAGNYSSVEGVEEF